MKEMAIGIVIGGVIASSFNSSIKNSTKSISQIGSEVKKLNKTKVDIKRFKELQKNTQGNRKEFVELGRSLKSAGYDLNNFSKDTIKLNTKLKDLKKNLIIRGNIEIEKKGLIEKKDSLLATIGSGMAIGGLINLRSEVLQAQGELKSLKIGNDGIEKITAEAKSFTNSFAGTSTPEFIRAAYDIKSGISSLSDEAVGKFTRMAAITAGATKSTTAQMTSFFATAYGIYSKQFDSFASKNIDGWDQLSQEEKDIKFGETFSAGIGSAVQMFKTDGTKMQSAIETLGSAATTSNVPLDEQIAILGQMQKSFASGSEAATAYKGFLSGAVSAQEKLGLEFLDTNNQLKSAPLILEQLRQKYGETLDDMEKAEIKNAFGTEEGMKFITAFYGEVDELKTNIDQLGASMQNGTKTVDDMIKATQQGKRFQLFGQQLANLGATVGKIFYPAVEFATTAIGGLVVGLDYLITEFPLVSNTLGYVVAGFFAYIAISKTFLVISAAKRIAMLSLRGSFLANIGMVKALRLNLARLNIMSTLATAKQWLFNVALNANPVGLIITGITALIGLGVLLYNKFEPFKNLIDGIVGSVGSVVKSIGGWLGFGGDEEKAKTPKIGSHLKKATVSTAAATQLAVSQPTVPKVAQTTNHIKVVVNNPSSNVEVEKAIVNAMNKNGTDRDLSDEDI